MDAAPCVPHGSRLGKQVGKGALCRYQHLHVLGVLVGDARQRCPLQRRPQGGVLLPQMLQLARLAVRLA